MCFGLAAVGVRHLGGEGVQREVAQQVAAHAAVDLVEAAAGVFDPGEGDRGGETLEVGTEIDVADQLRGSGEQEQQVFEEQGEGAQQGRGSGLALGSGAVLARREGTRDSIAGGSGYFIPPSPTEVLKSR